MMDITKSREAFEAWWNAPEQAELRNSCIMGWGFRIWKASRESLLIDLPQKISEFNRMPDNGAILLEAVNYDEAIDDCAEAIRAEGIRIKGESE
ncbi:hypothetical protein [Yersinia kristensenii]|uniref:hypothetical protein n=1 Tax=Yersinia kristensenii TaxID=28152 RepID=UPI0005DBC188|nr:hypothetical protein [Yersinia kristensenii]CNG28414.1 Uncharacterised protein [Yersinia kristensenii]CNJ68536.1 Uncharacterised protein [Yersinia kristensenii]